MQFYNNPNGKNSYPMTRIDWSKVKYDVNRVHKPQTRYYAISNYALICLPLGKGVGMSRKYDNYARFPISRDRIE